MDVGTGSLRSFSEKSSLIKWVVWLTINLSWEREREEERGGLVRWERRQRYTLGLWNNPQSSGTNRYSAAGISSYLRVLSLDHSTHPQTNYSLLKVKKKKKRKRQWNEKKGHTTGVHLHIHLVTLPGKNGCQPIFKKLLLFCTLI